MFARNQFRVFALVFGLFPSLVAAADNIISKPILLDKKSGRVVHSVLVVPFTYNLTILEHLSGGEPPNSPISEVLRKLRILNYSVTSVDHDSFFRSESQPDIPTAELLRGKGGYSYGNDRALVLAARIQDRDDFKSYLKHAAEVDAVLSMYVEATPSWVSCGLGNDRGMMRLIATAAMFRIEKQKLKPIWAHASETFEVGLSMKATSPSNCTYFTYDGDEAKSFIQGSLMSSIQDALSPLPATNADK